MMPRIQMIVGRCLLAALFVAGTVQKIAAPEAVMELLVAHNLPPWLVWPATLFNAVGAAALIFGLWLGPTLLALSLYCMVTSLFHWIPDDPWQMSIFIKNWAIAGGLLAFRGALSASDQKLSGAAAP